MREVTLLGNPYITGTFAVHSDCAEIRVPFYRAVFGDAFKPVEFGNWMLFGQECQAVFNGVTGQFQGSIGGKFYDHRCVEVTGDRLVKLQKLLAAR